MIAGLRDLLYSGELMQMQMCMVAGICEWVGWRLQPGKRGGERHMRMQTVSNVPFFFLQINVLFRAAPHAKPIIYVESTCVCNYESEWSINVCVCGAVCAGWIREYY